MEQHEETIIKLVKKINVGLSHRYECALLPLCKQTRLITFITTFIISVS